MNPADLIQLLQIFLPVAIYFGGSAIAKNGYIAYRKQQQRIVDRRKSKVDQMFDGLERRS